MRTLMIAALAAATLGAGAAGAQAVKPYLTAALNDPARAADKATDARRKTAEVLAFSGVKPGDRVVDLIPGSGYFSKVFSKVPNWTTHSRSFGIVSIAIVATAALRDCDRTAPCPANGNPSHLAQCDPMHRNMPATHLNLR